MSAHSRTFTCLKTDLFTQGTSSHYKAMQKCRREMYHNTQHVYECINIILIIFLENGLRLLV